MIRVTKVGTKGNYNKSSHGSKRSPVSTKDDQAEDGLQLLVVIFKQRRVLELAWVLNVELLVNNSFNTWTRKSRIVRPILRVLAKQARRRTVE
jgi:hypothetical protein